MSQSVDLSREFLERFLAEADELLSGASRQLLDVEGAAGRGASHPRAVRELFRLLHTLKGLAAMVGVEPVVELAHAMEDLLRDADRAGGRLPAGAVDPLLEGVRVLDGQVRALAARQAVRPCPPSLLAGLAALQAAATGKGAPAPAPALPPELESKLTAADREQLAQGLAAGMRAVRVDFVPSREKVAAGLNITRVRERLGALGELVKVVPRAAPGTPGGLAFLLLVLTRGGDAALGEAVEAGPDAVQQLAAPTPAPASPAGASSAASASASSAALPSPAAGAAPADAGPSPDGPPPPGEEADTDTQTGLAGYVRVDVARLDDALEKLSSLVVTRFRLARAVADLAGKGADTRELAAILQESTRQLRELRASIMLARMVPLPELLGRVPLIVRGLARSTGKTVSLSLETGRVELDKSVAERIFPAVVHLVRNAVDHALETPAERQRAGKPPEGRLTIACADAAGTHLLLSVSDDGRGIDAAAVARKAGRPAPTSDEELLELVCRPGLSTREEASHTSGRGMGMDIVKRTVEQLGGTLELQTAAGRGTRFSIRVPLSITIVDTLAFEAGGQVFVTPVAGVEEILELDPARLVDAPAPVALRAGARLLERRGEAVPLVDLVAVLGGTGLTGPAAPAAPAAPAGGMPRKALLVRRGGAPLAFAVERMLGQQEVVVRPLEDPLVRVPGVSGATDLGTGRPTLVLDLSGLGALLGPRGAGAKGAAGKAPTQAAPGARA
jgi:two-component system chemotaxis sensor kinase CheA